MTTLSSLNPKMTPQRWVDLESGKASLDDDDGDSVVAYQQSNNETIPTARSPAKTYFEDYPAATIAAPSESPESTLLVRPSLVQQSRLRDIEYSTQHRPKEMKRKTVIFCKRKKFLFLDTTQRSRAHPSFSKSPSQLRDEHVYNAINVSDLPSESRSLMLRCFTSRHQTRS